jgi:type I restriction enzyme M protein
LGVADDILRDVYVRGKYRDVILPMTVIRRLDAVLEPTKQSVLVLKKQLDKAGVTNQDAALRQTAGQAFYNTSPFNLRDLKSRSKTQQLKATLKRTWTASLPTSRRYLTNSVPQPNTYADRCGHPGYLIERFLDSSINLSPNPVYDQNGNIKIPALDNHAMGTIFEELIRRFNEENKRGGW